MMRGLRKSYFSGDSCHATRRRMIRVVYHAKWFVVLKTSLMGKQIKKIKIMNMTMMIMKIIIINSFIYVFIFLRTGQRSAYRKWQLSKETMDGLTSMHPEPMLEPNLQLLTHQFRERAATVVFRAMVDDRRYKQASSGTTKLGVDMATSSLVV